MPISTADLLKELKILRKGRGLNSGQLEARVGPALRELAKTTRSDSNEVTRQKIIEWLHEHTSQLPRDLKRCVEAALAVTSADRRPFYQDRIDALANEFHRDQRTIRRHVDEALTQLAEVAIPVTHGRASSVHDWYVSALEGVLRLDGPAPECFERRRITAIRDGLDELTVSLSIPQAASSQEPPQVDMAAVFGIRVLNKERVTASRFQFTLRLPRTLKAGESAEYGIIVRLPEGQPMRPHYTFIPERRAEKFDVRVCFPLNRPPARAWLVTAAFNRDIDDRAFSHDILTPNAVGEFHASFTNLKPAFGYGIQWEDAGE